MGVKSTQLYGMRSQITSWIEVINKMDGYEETDYNNLYELACALENALDQIAYELKQQQ